MRPTRPLADYTRAIELAATKAPWYMLFNRGLAYKAVGQTEKAIEDLTKAIELGPKKNVKTWFHRGIAYLTLKQFDAAIRDFSKAIQINPKHFDSWNGRGMAYKGLGQLNRALAEYEKAIELSAPRVPWYVLFERGLALRAVGQTEKAIKDFTRSIKLNPKKRVNSWFQRGMAYTDLDQFDNAGR